MTPPAPAAPTNDDVIDRRDVDDRHTANDANDASSLAIAEHVQVIREGHGANCSSIGSVIDTLFVAQVVAGALLAAVAAALTPRAETKTETATETKSPPKGST